MANFTGFKADELRKAMGKKNIQIIEKLKTEFIEGAQNNNIDTKTAEDVYELMAKFGQYGFNRSHSAAYSVIAYQTAYLKAQYPAEFMSAILTNNLNDIKKITFYLTECKRHNITVLGPDINESELKFIVNQKGEIRFGLAAIKNVGEGVVTEIINERDKNGPFTDIFDLAKRVSNRALNKKCMESLVLAGAFDSFPETHRAQYFYQKSGEESNFIEKIIKNASSFQNGKQVNQASLFGDSTESTLPEIDLPDCEPWSKYVLLQKEKEIVGFYISGHPLDEFRIEIENFCNNEVGKLKTEEELKKLKNKEIRFAAIITSSAEKMTKKGDPFGSVTIEDYNDTMTFNLFKEDYLKFRHLLISGQIIFIKSKVQGRYNAEDQLELKITNISLLSEVIEKYAKSVNVTLPLTDITEEAIQELNGIISSNKGSNPFKLTITDESENNTIELHSKKAHVNISNFVKQLSKKTMLDFKLN
jgi:DNA polymerase III subunit alpha